MALADPTPLVMDVLPWPHGHGFSGTDIWWEYILSQEERQRLDQLMGIALLDETICDRLVHQRDDSLFTAFGISEKTQKWLGTISANSLAELAQAIVTQVNKSVLTEA